MSPTRLRRAQGAAPLSFNTICNLKAQEAALAPFYAQVDADPAALTGQHPIRRWEYAMALRAIHAWQQGMMQDGVERPGFSQASPPLQICDLGGAGSNFWHLLQAQTTAAVQIIDPATPDHQLGVLDSTHSPMRRVWFAKQTVEEYAAAGVHQQFDVLTAISVIEHVKEIRPFLRAIAQLLKPGGLLVLTTDYWDAEGADVAHFHWMRERIYNPLRLRSLRVALADHGFRTFGPDGEWFGAHPPMCYDYTVAALAWVTR